MSILTAPLATNDGGKVSGTMAVFIAIIGLLVLFLVIVALLRISFRGTRRRPDVAKSNLDLDAWREAGDRTEPLDAQKSPDE